MSDNICIHHTDAERDAWRIGCPICLSKKLAASQQEVERLREALEIIQCDARCVGDEWLSAQQDGIRSIIRNIREKSSAALSSDAERLDFVIEKMTEQEFRNLSDYPSQAREEIDLAIDAEIERTGRGDV